MHSDFQVLFRFCATALLYCCVAPAAMAAEPAGGTTPQAGISRDQADAMLLELREIRKLLENIDQKGLAQAAAQPRKPRTATVTIDPDRPAMGSAGGLARARHGGRPRRSRALDDRRLRGAWSLA